MMAGAASYTNIEPLDLGFRFCTPNRPWHGDTGLFRTYDNYGKIIPFVHNLSSNVDLLLEAPLLAMCHSPLTSIL